MLSASFIFHLLGSRYTSPMDIQVAALCDSAADYSGKLCLLGVFDTILASALPAVHPQCAIAFRIVFRREDEGRHRFLLNIVDEDGKSIVPSLEAAMEIEMQEDCFFVSRNLVLNLHQLQFEKEGLYSVDVTINDQPEISIPVQVRLPPPQT
jgi:hypothetical protein